MTWLNAGCGQHHPDGWLTMDVSGDCEPDICGPLSDIPLADGSVSRILASHVLEHLAYHDDLPLVLAEFRRVLADDGELCAVGPDIERAVMLGEGSQLLRFIIRWPDGFRHLGAQDPPSGHAWTATGPLTERALTSAGFSFTSYSGRLRQLEGAAWPLPDLGDWQNGYLCRKEA